MTTVKAFKSKVEAAKKKAAEKYERLSDAEKAELKEASERFERKVQSSIK